MISFLAPGADKPTRLRASTLGEGFGPEDIRAVIAGERPVPEIHDEAPPPPPRRVDFWIDIENRMRPGMGPGYKRWATIHNIKQMADTLQLVRERGLSGYEDLSVKADEATARFHTLAGELKTAEDELSQTAALMAAVVQFAKTRPVFDGYKAAQYSKKYLAEHEAELADYRAAKAAMNELLGGAKLPKMDVLKKRRRELAEKRKALYTEYRAAQRDMRELTAAKGNLGHLYRATEGRRQSTLGHFVPKFAGLGSSPTSIFAAPSGRKNSKCPYTCPACQNARPQKLREKRRSRCLLRFLRFLGFFDCSD